MIPKQIDNKKNLKPTTITDNDYNCDRTKQIPHLYVQYTLKTRFSRVELSFYFFSTLPSSFTGGTTL